jgi:hypothetical protein
VHRSDGFGKNGPSASRMTLALAEDGAIELRTSFTELGQNLVGAIRATCDQLGCGPDEVARCWATPGCARFRPGGRIACHHAGLAGGDAGPPGLASGAAGAAAAQLQVDAHTLRLGPGGGTTARACA